MADPVRPGVKELIGLFHQAGIDTIMITADQSATAYAIGKELGLSRSGELDILDSTKLEQLDPEVLRGLAQKVSIFSRVSPANKLQLIHALQRSGKVAAMTGDGINDGPALRAAISVSRWAKRARMPQEAYLTLYWRTTISAR